MSLFIAFTILFILGVSLFLLTLPKKNSRGDNRKFVSKESVQKSIAEIDLMLNSAGPANFKQAILEGDKLVDLVLKSRVSGDTMGERLKKAEKLFSSKAYNELWSAHKIRNRLAHELGYEGLSSEARFAVSAFRKALKELGY